MQIVIDIPEEIKAVIDKNGTNEIVAETVWQAIKKGTPLPKGHGRLIDADKLEPRDISPEAWYSPMWGFELVDIEDAPTIIEADKEVQDDDRQSN
jgi:hypothetical protein